MKHVCHTALVSVLPPLFEPPRPCEYKASDAKDGIPEPAPPEDEPPEPLHTVGAPVHVICKSRCSSARSPPAKKLVLEPVNNNAPGVPGTPMSERKVYSTSNKIVTKERYKVKEKRRKERRKRDYGKSPLVYYARTETKSPFEPIEEPHNCEHRAYHNRKDNGVKVTLDRNYFVSNQEINKGYLSNMVRKQYEHYPMGTAISGTSEFSTPVCRDPPPHAHDTKRNESDICSCCHGTFHNIDDTMRLPPHGVMRDTTTLHSISQYAQPVSNNNVFYDSSLYDVEPVREKTMKQRRDEIDDINPDSKRFATRDVYLSNAKRVKLRKQHNYRNTTPLRVIPKYYAHRKRNNSGVTTQRKESLNILPELIKTSWKRKDSPRASFVSAIDLSPVYTRPNCNFNNSNFSSIPAKIPVELKNAECHTTSVNNSECQTTSTKSVQLETSNTVDENKTEITLNQIKTILQLVLTEVKTSAQSRIAHERIPKKDAVVQKDQSLNNMQSQPAPVPKAKPMHDAVSSIMNSCNYSPYNLRPYGPSCSRLPPSGPLSSFQPNCMHNYPLFIQTTGRQCTCCYRSIPKGVNATGPALMSHASPPNVTQQPPATIATNTEKRSNRELPSRSPETDKLIQEIYKSIAVNMDHFAKNSTSDCNDLKSSSPSKKTTETGLPTDNERKKQVGIAMVHRQSNILSSVRSKSVLSPAPVSKTTLGTPSPRHSQRQTYAFVKERVSSESLQREMVTLRRRGAVLVRSSSSQSDSSTLTSNASESEKTVTRPRVDDQVGN